VRTADILVVGAQRTHHTGFIGYAATVDALIGLAGGLVLFGLIWVVGRTFARESWGRTWSERSPEEIAALNRKRPILYFGTLVVCLAIILPIVILVSH
jgi:hypothetical protein